MRWLSTFAADLPTLATRWARADAANDARSSRGGAGAWRGDHANAAPRSDEGVAHHRRHAALLGAAQRVALEHRRQHQLHLVQRERRAQAASRAAAERQIFAGPEAALEEALRPKRLRLGIEPR